MSQIVVTGVQSDDTLWLVCWDFWLLSVDRNEHCHHSGSMHSVCSEHH